MTDRKPNPMFGEGDHVIGYMCLTDFECELGGNVSGNVVYPSEKTLRKHRKCVDECGIVKVRVEAVGVVQKPDFKGP